MASTKKTTAELALELAMPTAEAMELTIWDVTFAKEGTVWILRYQIEGNDGTIDIDTCEKFSRTVEKVLDESDPIKTSYTLEVSSPGIERELKKDWHYDYCMGEKIDVKLIRPVDGVKELCGILTGYDKGEITMQLDAETEVTLNKSEASHVKLHFDF